MIVSRDMYITLITVYLLGIFYFIVNTGWKVEMILELSHTPQATQQQQQEAGQPLLQLYSSYFYEGKVYITIQYRQCAVFSIVL